MTVVQPNSATKRKRRNIALAHVVHDAPPIVVCEEAPCVSCVAEVNPVDINTSSTTTHALATAHTPDARFANACVDTCTVCESESHANTNQSHARMRSTSAINIGAAEHTQVMPRRERECSATSAAVAACTSPRISTTPARSSSSAARSGRRVKREVLSPQLVSKISKVTRKSKQKYEMSIRALRVQIQHMEKLVARDGANTKERQRIAERQRKHMERTKREVLRKVRTMRENKRTNSNMEAGGGVKRKRTDEHMEQARR